MIPDKCLPSGIESLDEILSGGLVLGQFVQIYGEAASGKTSLGLVFVNAAYKQGLRSIIINTEYSSPLERLEQITAQPFSQLEDYIRIIVPKTFEEQGRIIEDLELILKKNTGLVMIDTFTKLYRISLEDKETNYAAHRELNRQAGLLKGLAVKHKLVVLALNQVRGKIGNEKEKFEPVAGNIMDYWSDCIIKIEHGSQSGERRIQYTDKQGNSKFCALILGNEGLRATGVRSSR